MEDLPDAEKIFQINENETYFMCALYILLGIFAIFANLLNILFYLCQADLRKSHAYIIAIDFGEMINGLSYILTGIGRGTALIQGQYLQPISISDCFFTTYWPAFLLIGPETTGLLTILVSFERFVAVNLPHKYENLFHEERKYLWFIVVAMVQLGFLTVAAFSAYRNEMLFSDRHCAIINSTADFFSTFHFCFVVLSYVVSFVSLFIVYNFQNSTVVSTLDTRSSRDPKIYVFLLMTGVDVIVVSFPSILMLGTKWKYWYPNDIIVGLATSTFGLLSIIHIIFNVIYDARFRQRVLICYNKVRNNSMTTNISREDQTKY